MRLVGQGHALALHGGNTIEMNVSDWHNGIYFYGVFVEDRLAKQRQVLMQR
jgi:hypothetical protein